MWEYRTMKDENSFYKDEMARLERQQKDMHDQYNEENQEFNSEEYARQLKLGSMLKYGIAANERLSNYMIRLQVHIDLAGTKNIDMHVKNNGRGCWFTHKDKFGQGCFMCEDLNLIHYLTSIIGHFAHKYPEETLHF